MTFHLNKQVGSGQASVISGKDQTIIYFVVNRFQVARMKQIVTSIDPNAFIAISEVSDLLGKSVKK